jgi:hypothetical protein
MPRRVVKLDLTRPYHEYIGPDGETRLASPTVDSLLRKRKRKVEAKENKRVVIRHTRGL